jgi:hypothetical protein
LGEPVGAIEPAPRLGGRCGGVGAVPRVPGLPALIGDAVRIRLDRPDSRNKSFFASFFSKKEERKVLF